MTGRRGNEGYREEMYRRYTEQSCEGGGSEGMSESKKEISKGGKEGGREETEREIQKGEKSREKGRVKEESLCETNKAGFVQEEQ